MSILTILKLVIGFDSKMKEVRITKLIQAEVSEAKGEERLV